MPAQLGIHGVDRLGMLMFRATSARPDVIMVTVHDPLRASRSHGPALNYATGDSTHHHECWFLDVKRLSTHHLLQYFITSPRLLEAYLFLVVNKAFGLRLLFKLHDHRSCRASGFTSLQQTRGTDGEVINVGAWKHISCGRSSFVQGLWCRTEACSQHRYSRMESFVRGGISITAHSVELLQPQLTFGELETLDTQRAGLGKRYGASSEPVMIHEIQDVQ